MKAHIWASRRLGQGHHTHQARGWPHLLGGDEQDLVASFLDALFGAGDPDLIAGVIWAWDLDFGCSF